MALRRKPPRDVSVDTVRVRVLPDGRMDRDNAARYLGRARKTLAQWQTNGKGPPGKKVGGSFIFARTWTPSSLGKRLMNNAGRKYFRSRPRRRP
jgi:hypothetical protein